uniref:NADH-ubiquinone oxidoreductase chain 2 n=1 Tax=Orthocis pygmaeus TaxID=433259 RepID=A0A343C508_9CUCU|nr:NADH dehydrogenase subunit 2 [Orthocis pygmaeus]
MFLNTLIMGTFIAISSYSWFSMWMGLEINLLSAIPLFINSNNTFSTEASMKYFISQAIASMIIMFALMMIMIKSPLIMMSNVFYSILNSMLMLKMGAAPLHFWFPEVMEGLSWMNCVIMLTWQKISPMVIIMSNKPEKSVMLIFIVSSLVISVVYSFSQTSLRKIMTYSSINHISWMLASMMISHSMWMLYFFVYSTIAINILLMFNYINSNFINQLTSKNLNFMLTLNFLSMGGLPPFLGFLPKWLIINKLSENLMFMISFMLITSSLIMMFIYMRMFFPTMMMAIPKKKNKLFTSLKFIHITSTMILNSSLILFTLMFNLN